MTDRRRATYGVQRAVTIGARLCTCAGRRRTGHGRGPDDRRPPRSCGSSSAGRRPRASAACRCRRRPRRSSSPPPAPRRDEGMPLVVVLASTGADIVEGIAALEGWGRLARALVDCSGIVPTILVVDGPAVSGPALLLGVADLVVMTEASYAFVNGPVMVEEFTGVRISDRRARRRRRDWPARTGVPSLVVPTRDAAVDAVGDLLAYLPSSVDDEPPRWPVRRPRRSARARRPGELIPPIVDGQLRRPRRSPRRSSTRTACWRSATAGPPTSSPPSPRSAASRSVSSPTSRCRSPARWTSPARRRRPDSCRFCDAFNLPILTLVDTPGLLSGQGPRVAGHDPPRRPARVRLRAGPRCRACA